MQFKLEKIDLDSNVLDMVFDTHYYHFVGSAQYGCNSIFLYFSGETKNLSIFYLNNAF